MLAQLMSVALTASLTTDTFGKQLNNSKTFSLQQMNLRTPNSSSIEARNTQDWCVYFYEMNCGYVCYLFQAWFTYIYEGQCPHKAPMGYEIFVQLWGSPWFSKTSDRGRNKSAFLLFDTSFVCMCYNILSCFFFLCRSEAKYDW